MVFMLLIQNYSMPIEELAISFNLHAHVVDKMANVAAASAKIERTHLSLSLRCDLLQES